MEERKEIYTSKLQFEKVQLAKLKKHLHQEKKRLGTLKIKKERIAQYIKKKEKATALATKIAKEKAIALATKIAKEQAIALATKIAKEKTIALATKIAKEKTTALATKIAKEEAIALATKIAKEEAMALATKIAKEEAVALATKIAKEEAVALAKKIAKEEAVALAKKIAKEKKRKKYLAKLKVSREKKELKELETIDLLESDQLSDETALFLEDSQSQKLSSSSEFKPLNKWFKASAGFSSTLNNIRDNDYGREALKATIMVNPYSYFFAGTTMSFDLNNYKNIYYQPDFSYSFGYSDWHLDTFEFIYSNYANNKFIPQDGENRFNFQSGTWEASYKTKVDKVKLSAKVKYVPIKNSKKLYIKAKTVVGDNIMVSAQLKHTLNTHQNRVTLSAKTFVYDKFFISGSAYVYPESELQRSSDPDYAFSFGWKDSKPFHPSITYSNYYTPTRWDRDEGPKFKDATVSIKFNLKF